MRGDLERHQPDRRDPETMQIIQAARQAREIADAIAIAIHIGAYRKAINDRILVPQVIDHALFAGDEEIQQRKRLPGFSLPGYSAPGEIGNVRELYLPSLPSLVGTTRRTKASLHGAATLPSHADEVIE